MNIWQLWRQTRLCTIKLLFSKKVSLDWLLFRSNLGQRDYIYLVKSALSAYKSPELKFLESFSKIQRPSLWYEDMNCVRFSKSFDFLSAISKQFPRHATCERDSTSFPWPAKKRSRVWKMMAAPSVRSNRVFAAYKIRQLCSNFSNGKWPLNKLYMRFVSVCRCSFLQF